MGVGMTIDQASELIRHAFVVTLLLCAPVLVVGLVVTLIVSLLQSMTNIQEQTLSFIPKIVAMVLAAALLMPWFTQHLLDYAKTLFSGGMQ
jgi:flagellar biosynthesis protein FliQ